MQESLLYPPPPPTSFDTPSDILGYGYLDNMNFPTVGTTRIAQLRLEGPSHMPSTANTHSTFYGEEDTYDPYLNVFREFEAYSFSDDPDYRVSEHQINHIPLWKCPFSSADWCICESDN